MSWKLSPPQPKIKRRISDNKIRIMQITDPHIGSTGGTDYGFNGFLNAVEKSKIYRPEIFVCTGDMTPYGELVYLQRAFYLLNDAQAVERIMTIGNHDLEENTLGRGNVNLTTPRHETCWNSQDFYFVREVESGDKSWKVLILSLDQNYRGTALEPYYEQYERFGVYLGIAGDPTYGFYSFPPEQLAWMETQLAASNADAVLIFCHVNPTTISGGVALANILATDGRPAALFYGHNHGNALTVTLTATGGAQFVCYKPPGVSESQSWTLYTFGAGLALESAVINDYTDPGGWTINAPFVLA